MKKILFTLIFSICLTIQAQQALTSSQQFFETSGDITMLSLPALALGSTLIWKDGQKGGLQLSKSLASTVAVTYALKFSIEKERPNGKNLRSFPSGHTSVAFTSAAFLQIRYGWKVGIPAYALATYVGISRIESNYHDGWDVLAGAALGTGIAYLFTKPFDKGNIISVSPGFIQNTPTIGLLYKF